LTRSAKLRFRTNRNRLSDDQRDWNRHQQDALDKASTELHARVSAEHYQQRSDRDEKIAAEKAERNRLKAEEVEQEKAMADLIAPKPIPEALRFEHTHILGPSGSGKTTLIQDIILKDFYDETTKKLLNPPAYIIIDPKGELVEHLSKLALFRPGQPWHDRLVVIDPLDGPALNVFQSTGRNAADNQQFFVYLFHDPPTAHRQAGHLLRILRRASLQIARLEPFHAPRPSRRQDDER
jgi:hypothetical protein